MLLEAGADPSLKDDFGHTAMWEAVHSERDEILELLAKSGGKQALGERAGSPCCWRLWPAGAGALPATRRSTNRGAAATSAGDRGAPGCGALCPGRNRSCQPQGGGASGLTVRCPLPRQAWRRRTWRSP
jgi:hypothetical protein